MTSLVKVTLVSNITHSVYAARALHNLGVLDRYLGPVVLDTASRWSSAILPSAAAARSYEGVGDLPLRRLVSSELTARIIRQTPLPRWAAARIGSRVLDATASQRLGRPDIVHLNTAGLVRSVAKAKRQGALVVADHREVHPRAHTGEDPLMTRLEQELATADWVLANSERSASSLREWGIAPGKIVVIPLGVDVDLFTPGANRRAHERGDGPPKILYVGAMIPAKGLDTLLAALRDPGLQGATARLCGAKVDAQLVARCQAAPGVTVVGPLPRGQLCEEYRAADVLVLPSVNDAFGLVAAEALACGTPVVVTDECGVSALVTSDVGRVVPPSDPLKLAHAVVQAVGLNHLPETASRTRAVAESSSWQAYGQRLARWYSDVAIPEARAQTRP